MIVFVVGFQPANDNATVGGFEWRYKIEDAREYAISMLSDPKNMDGNHSLTFVPLQVPDGLDSDEITSWIDGSLYLVEVGRD